jgi:Domain of unknown function (DUF4936)
MHASYYIYYNVKPKAAAGVRAAVEELQRALLAKAGVAGRLLCRLDKPETWMEVYENVPDLDGFQAVLASELERLRFDELLGGGSPRQTEIFRPL